MQLSELEPVLTRALGRAAPASSDFDLNTDFVPPPGRKLRPAAVLVPVINGTEGAEVLLTKRSSRLKHHPGQIAFPGGKVDEGDASIEAAAHREAWEEIGLPLGSARIIGTLPTHETVTSFTMTSFVGIVDAPFVPVPEAGEVAEVFSVPFAHLSNPAMFKVERRRWQGRWRHYYTVPFGPYYIWGATARILRSLAEVMQQER
ncbi:MAG: CoA pyrophosphatase [Pseudomonadota bacterium]